MTDAIREDKLPIPHYVIVITQIQPEWAIKGGTWEKGGTREAGPVTQNGSSYGYTPQVSILQLSEREVYRQSVETLNLPAVIKAINGL